MKYFFLFLTLCLSIISCKDFLEEDTSTILSAESEALRTEEGLFAALAGAYKPMSFTWHTGFTYVNVLGVIMGSDDLTTLKYSCGGCGLREFDQFDVWGDNYRMKGIWDGCYMSIQGANLIIDNYKETTGEKAVIDQIAGEAYYLRAYNYFWIARLWEKAPLILNVPRCPSDVFDIVPSSTQEIYNQIISDLKMAIGLMADKRLQPGRASAASAKACLAEVYLQMTGWPLKQTDNYELAAQTAKELIVNQDKYGLKLMDDYADLWKSEFDGNSEEVFALTVSGVEGNWNGNAIYGAAARPWAIGGWSSFMSEITFYEDYPDQYRKEVTFYTGFIDDGEEIVWEEFSMDRPHYEKFFGDSCYWNLVKSQPLERFAEVYLIFAEAQIMATGNTSDSEALEALNAIVRRAYGEPLDQPSVYDYTSATQRQIIQEKAWEFAGEFSRWFDLVRLEMVEEVVAKKHSYDLQPIVGVKYWLPIPASEVELNEKLLY